MAKKTGMNLIERFNLKMKEESISKSILVKENESKDKNKDIKKSMVEKLSVDLNISKAEGEWKLTKKYARIEPAENGLILEVSQDWEFGETETHRRDWFWSTKQYIAKSVKEIKSKLDEEFKLLPGATMSFDAFEKKFDRTPDERKDGDVMKSIEEISKSIIILKTGEADGHIHTAEGNIIDRKINGVVTKVFKGKTKPEATYFLIEKFAADIVSSTYDEVSTSLDSHEHSFEINLTKFDETAWRVKGETKTKDDHYHHIDIVNFDSVSMSNTPDS